MADSDDKKTTGDNAAAPPGPIKDVQVDATVTPTGDATEEYVEKVKRRVESDVKDAIDNAAPDGPDKQIDAAKDAVDKALEQVDPSKIVDIEAEVYGSQDGDPYYEYVPGTDPDDPKDD